ncbi:MAG: hypothetical protein ACJ74H_22455 [Thermoanaerobaculia bacterium]
MPYWSTEIQTTIPPDEVVRRLQKLVRPREGFWESIEKDLSRPPDRPPLKGTVSDRTFKVWRAIGYKNSFLPTIRGRIDYGVGGGSTVRLRMMLHPFTAAFLVVWFGGFTLALVFAEHDGNHWTFVATPVLFAALILGAFYPEARIAERIIRKALA